MFLKNLLKKFSLHKNTAAQITNPRPRVAVLIDAENISPKNIHSYLKEIEKRGEIFYKAAYGSGLLLQSKSWKNTLLLHAIEPRQVLNIKKGKNTSDLEITASAIELFYEKKHQVTCIISGDCDYSVAVQKLRARNHEVMVIAKMDIPETYMNSVSNLIFEETIPGIAGQNAQRKSYAKAAVKAVHPAVTVPVSNPSANSQNIRKNSYPPVQSSLLDSAYEITPKGKSGFPSASNFNNMLKKVDSTFHYKNYGFQSFKHFLSSLHPRFEMICPDNRNIFVKRNK